MNIILCGMPGSGKSYFGAIAAEQLNLPFIDTDLLVVSHYSTSYYKQASCREIRLKEGESFFRHLESQVIKGLQAIQSSVIAVGGGALCANENVEILKNLGEMIYLKVAPHILLKRLMSRNPLPSYLDPANIEDSFEALLEQRTPLYEQHCHDSVDPHSENILKMIKKKWQATLSEKFLK